MAALDFLATCAFGLEAVVRRELASLGYAGRITSPGRVAFSGDEAAICRTNLWLRCADRVLIQIASFPATDFDTLFETTRALPWDQWAGPDAALPVTGRSAKSQLSSVPACQRTVKKAIVQQLMAAHGVGALPETGPAYKVDIAMVADQATLTIDTSGPGLSKRGYRVRADAPPLKETLAAALVLLSFWKGDRPLADPFCGTGTIPIEAAMLGCNLAPGRLRSFAAQQWPQLDPALWRAARDEADSLRGSSISEKIIGTDIDGGALQAARRSAESAGVADQIHFQTKPFERWTSNRQHGCLITQPPSLAHAADPRSLQAIYRSIPEVLRHLPTWSHYILTDHPGFESLIGRTADRRRKLYLGRNECTFYQFHGPQRPAAAGASASPERRDAATDAFAAAEEPSAAAGDATPAATDSEAIAGGESVAAAETVEKPLPRRPDKSRLPAAFGHLPPKAYEQAQLFRSRLLKRARHLRRWPTRQGITCFRLYERDIPEIPLVVDRYEDHLHLAEYERPHDRDPAQHGNWLDLMAETAAQTLEVSPERVFFKRRGRQRGAEQHQRLAEQRYEIEVGEGGLRFIVNLSDYIDTGLFLDHRITRSMVREGSSGKDFLNLFAYTGAFTVYAAAGGAATTTTVDWSHAYLDWARRNLALNGFDGPAHRRVRSDAMEFLLRHPVRPSYDLAVVDPPTFSNSKRSDADWDVQRNYAPLLNHLLPLMKPGGVIYFSTNFRRFKFDPAAVPVSRVHEISSQTVPADFRNRRIHRCWKIFCPE